MHCHSQTIQSVIPSAVLLASLLGSGHCALMCGGLVVSAAKSFWENFFYHVSRMTGYMLLGAFSGWLGHHAANHVPPLFSELLAWFMALSFIVLGAAGWRGGGWHLSLPGMGWVNRITVTVFRNLMQASPSKKIYYSAAIGFLSIFLPCGWLYSFVLASASVASPWQGAAMMGIFWAGTLPALVLSPLVLRRIFSVTEKFAPKISALLLIAAGIIPLLMRYVRFS